MINRRELLIGGGGAALAVGLSSLTSISGATADFTTQNVDGFVHPEWLIDTPTLAALIKSGAPRILALQKPEEFETSHVPGAQLVRYDETDLDDTSESSIAVWRQSVLDVMKSLGVTTENAVVVYDGGSFHAARLWWLLDQIGYREVQILNGGLPAWIEAGEAIESGVVPLPADASQSTAEMVPNEAGVATIDEVIQALESGKAHFVDARQAEDFHKGHIPGAISIPIEANAAADGPKYWKSAEELEAVYQSIPKDGLVIPYCAGGVRSAVTYFTLLQIGYQNVSLFTGSWKEWSAHPELPVEIG